MRLTSLRLQNFRNHLQLSFEFGPGTNVLLGDNGQGKTNIIEAISYLCLTKSFYASTDAVVLNFEETMFEIEGTLCSDSATENRVRVVYDKQVPRKAYFINRRSVEPFSSVIGKFPVVICSPEHAPITMGSPGDRRKFVDLVISQSNESYFKTLIEYRHTLKQRNRILFDAKISGRDVSGTLDPWSEQLITLGGTLMHRRKTFMQEFQPYVRSAYHRLVEVREEPSIEYLPAVSSEETSTDIEFQNLLRLSVGERSVEERQIGTTLVGPHRDEFACKINGQDLRKFASQGQHKTFLVALKLAEFFYLKERCNETPLMLLDDIFSELDEHRSGRLLSFVGDISQTFITSTALQIMGNVIDFDGRNRKFFINPGAGVSQNPLAVS
ncbi:MAG: DNA replication and repair protein RecF [Bacteroidota bacterium]